MAAGAGVGRFSVDSSDLPIFSGPQLAERYPDEERDNSPSVPPLIRSLHCLMWRGVGSHYLVLIKICNDHADKQGEANHAPQEDKNVDVDAVDLCIEKRLVRRRQTSRV